MKTTMSKKRRFILICLTFLVVAGQQLSTALALDRLFCEQNSILYSCIDPCDESNQPSGTPAGELAGDTPAEAFATGNQTRETPRMIIVHTTDGDTLKAAEDALHATGNSYHTIIDKDGTETRIVSDDKVANGAGGANGAALHVSVVSPGDGSQLDPNSPQMQTLAKRIAEWSKKYNIPIEKVSGAGILNGGTTTGIAGHSDVSDVSADSKDHHDAGKDFPWEQVLANARKYLNGAGSSKCCPSAGSGAAQGSGDGGGCGEKKGDSKANKDQVWGYLNNKFRGAGFSAEEAERAAAGVMGNWQQESGFNPDRHNAPNPGRGCVNDSGGVVPGGLSELGPSGLGIAQWCGDRQTKLKEFAGDRGISCLGAQLEFLWHELEGDYKSVVESMKSASSAEVASNIFVKDFEVGHDAGIRAQYAGELYKEYTGKDPGTLSKGSGSNCPGKGTGGISGKDCASAMAAFQSAVDGGKLTYQDRVKDDLEHCYDGHFSDGTSADCKPGVQAVTARGLAAAAENSGVQSMMLWNINEGHGCDGMDHGKGLASDIAQCNGARADSNEKECFALFDYLIDNAEELDIRWIIWNGAHCQEKAAANPNIMECRGDHSDHIHVSFKEGKK